MKGGFLYTLLQQLLEELINLRDIYVVLSVVVNVKKELR